MLEYLWAESESWPRRVLLAPLWLAEGPYRAGAWIHRNMYKWGLRRVVRLPPRVISVGNLTVGGSGKTPMVGWLAAELRKRGRKVAILSRGVRGARSAEVNVVSDGERVFFSPAEVGDEPVWLASTVPGVPVLAGRNRVALGLRAAAVFGAEVLILDDGFQHHRVARDLDLVCVDAQLGLGNGHVLPRGPLREPRSALRNAHAILFTRVSRDPEAKPCTAGLPPGLPQFRVGILPRGLRSLDGSELTSCDKLRGQRVALLAAIARADRMKRDLEALGAAVVELRTYPDHHLYKRKEIEALDPAHGWVTTAKDAVKIPPSWAAGRRIAVMEEEVRPEEPHRLMEWILERLDRVHWYE
jgi:tetraacyldisaccharide 4'-kinase